jgi:hypothetical protein
VLSIGFSAGSLAPEVLYFPQMSGVALNAMALGVIAVQERDKPVIWRYLHVNHLLRDSDRALFNLLSEIQVVSGAEDLKTG